MKWYIGWSKLKKRYDIFESLVRPSRALFGKKYQEVVGPYSFVGQAHKDALKFARGKESVYVINPVGSGRTKSKNGMVEIYENIEAIEATKGKDSLWPKGKFRHDFNKKGTKVLGLSDGSLLITNPKHRLWKKFDYD